jgi:hypothetical protein
MGVLDPN